jgi:type VII secretion protein EccE
MKPAQIVVGQLAVAVVVAGFAAGPGWSIAAAVLAALLLALAFGRFRRRWAWQWLAHGYRYLDRPKTLPMGADAASMLNFVRPAAGVMSIDIDGASVGVVRDAHGLTGMIEVGDSTGLLGEVRLPVPALTALLPPHAANGSPPMRVQLLVTSVAAPTSRAGSGASATSYRQLTDGRILAQQRVVIAVHARRAGGFGPEELTAALINALRRVRRRLDRDRLPCRLLAADSVLRVLAEVAHHDPIAEIREHWSALEVGGLRQATFRLSRWPEGAAEFARGLLPRLLTLPCAGATVSIAAEPTSGTPPAPDGQAAGDPIAAELTVRLAATDPAALANVVAALRRLLEATGARLEPLDGAQLDGLAATLPLGAAASGPRAALSGLVSGHDALAVGDGPAPAVGAEAIGAIEPSVGGEGLMLGVNRKGDPVVVRLFRPEPTRAALVGGLRCAQTVVLRALAIGAEVAVLSGRPYAWEPFVRGVSSSERIRLMAPGTIVEPPPATLVQPQLVVVDVGSVGATGVPVVEAPWRATLLVREELTPSDLDVLARADLALLQPLRDEEATLAAKAFGLGETAGWLTRIRGDMLGVVVGRHTVRWALLSSTPIERQLIGAATR